MLDVSSVQGNCLCRKYGDIMWALSGLSTNEAGDIEQQLGVGGLWSVLLFRQADETILRGLEQNWELFNSTLGEYSHVITLLDIKRIGHRVSLSFPSAYEHAVGEFCNRLDVPLDKLPALVLLNGRSRQFTGNPYWSLRRASLREGSEALIRLVSDMNLATRLPPPSTEPEKMKWLGEASERLLSSASGREMRGFVSENSGVVVSLLQATLDKCLSRLLPWPSSSDAK